MADFCSIDLRGILSIEYRKRRNTDLFNSTIINERIYMPNCKPLAWL